ncbi:subtilisin-like protein [Martensiomyces pterosporus]|nr:subtilisin-like protein [Martensiomyces pterosporus]
MKISTSGLLFAIAYLGHQAVAQTTSDVAAVGTDSKVVSYPSHIRTKPGAYIVELDGDAGATNVASFSSNINNIPEVSVDKQYNNVFNGFSVKTSKDFDPVKLASVPGIKRVWPVTYRSLPYQASSQNLTYPYLHQKTGVARVIQDLGITGKGVKIGIIDSGVDYNHPELGNCWKTPGCPWQYGSDFIGDNYDPNSPNPVATPGPLPMDCGGHGTHVSGIIGAQGPKVYGVAPGATLGMYRIFSCPFNGKTSSSDDVILSGIEAAYKDGHNILSLSLGGGGWPEDPLSVVCSKLTRKGITVVVANGNDGSSGLYTAGSPAVGHGVISVGSIDNWNNTGSAAVITSSAGTKPIMISTPGNESIPFVFPTDVPLVAPADSTNSVLGCNNFTMSLAGKIALISRGSCTFTQKAQNAQNAGAIGVLIYNNVEGIMSPSVTAPVTIPAVIITMEDGQYILTGLSNGNVTVKAPKSEVVTAPSTTGGQMSDFSSYGPSPELDIAPLISAPGGNIFSTYPLKLGGYASLSGTSMATPYISGTIALLKQARPDLTVQQIREILFTSAKPLTDSATGKNIHPYHSGAGLVNIYDAITSRVTIDPPSIALNDSNWGWLDKSAGFQPNFPTRWAVRTLTIKNTDKSKSARVSFANSPADSLSSSNADGTFTPNPRVWPASTASVDKSTLPQVFTPDLTTYNNAIAPGQSRRVTVFIVAPYGLKESDRWFYGGFLNFTLNWDGESTQSSYVVPYAGFNGNYRKSDVLSVPSEGLPIITDAQGNPATNLATYGATAAKPLVVNYRLEIPSRIVAVTLLDSHNKTLGYLPYGYSEYVIRNYQDPASFASSALVNGTVYKDTKAQVPVKVPAGLYHARVAALRPFGRPKTQSDYQTWDSPAFSLA